MSPTPTSSTTLHGEGTARVTAAQNRTSAQTETGYVSAFPLPVYGTTPEGTITLAPPGATLTEMTMQMVPPGWGHATALATNWP